MDRGNTSSKKASLSLDLLSTGTLLVVLWPIGSSAFDLPLAFRALGRGDRQLAQQTVSLNAATTRFAGCPVFRQEFATLANVRDPFDLLLRSNRETLSSPAQHVPVEVETVNQNAIHGDSQMNDRNSSLNWFEALSIVAIILVVTSVALPAIQSSKSVAKNLDDQNQMNIVEQSTNTPAPSTVVFPTGSPAVCCNCFSVDFGGVSCSTFNFTSSNTSQTFNLNLQSYRMPYAAKPASPPFFTATPSMPANPPICFPCIGASGSWWAVNEPGLTYGGSAILHVDSSPGQTILLIYVNSGLPLNGPMLTYTSFDFSCDGGSFSLSGTTGYAKPYSAQQTLTVRKANCPTCQ